MRVIVCGSRNWTDEAAVDRALTEVMQPEMTIVHGDCPTGADAMAEHCAHLADWEIERHPAKWVEGGRAAGMIRNAQMAKRGADLCIAFWDGKSPGTRHMIECATKCGIPVRIVPATRAGKAG